MAQDKLPNWRDEFPPNGPSADDAIERRQRYIQLRRCEIRDLAETNAGEGLALIARCKALETMASEGGDVDLLKVSISAVKMGLDGVRATTQAIDVMIRGLIEEARNLGVTGKEVDAKSSVGDQTATLVKSLRHTKAQVRAVNGTVNAGLNFMERPIPGGGGASIGPDPDAFVGADEAIAASQEEECRAAASGEPPATD
jgi:hypothetical protein